MRTIYEDTDYKSITEHIKEYSGIFKITENDVFSGEGYEYRNQDYSKPLFGTKFAMVHQLAAFYHEYAHAVDMAMENPERLLSRSFGMHYSTKVTVFDREYDQPITCQATERECRALAIQAKLYAHTFKLSEGEALSETLKESSKSLLLMEDIYNLKTPDNLDYKEKFRQSRIEETIIKHFQSISIEQILEQTNVIADYRNYQNWPDNRLEKKAFHDVYLIDLKQHIPDALNLWPELNDKIKKEDIENFLTKNENSKNEKTKHIEKIVSCINNKNNNPIELSINPEKLNLSEDSKHQLAALSFQNKTMIKAKISGSERDIMAAQLFGPNPFAEELLERKKNAPKKHKKLGL